MSREADGSDFDPTLIRLVPLLGKPSLPWAELLGLADTFTERLAAAGKANLRT